MRSPGEILRAMIKRGPGTTSDEAAIELGQRADPPPTFHAGGLVSVAPSITAATISANAITADTLRADYEENKEDSTLVKSLTKFIQEIGVDQLNMALEDMREEGEKMPFLTLKSNYQVTFQDPTKPAGTAFKRFGCFGGDSFHLNSVRDSGKNFIFIFDVGENVARNMRNFAKGPGLSVEWNKAEFTMKVMDDDRMSATEFLTDLKHTYGFWNSKTRHNTNEDIDRGEAWGSW